MLIGKCLPIKNRKSRSKEGRNSLSEAAFFCTVYIIFKTRLGRSPVRFSAGLQNSF